MSEETYEQKVERLNAILRRLDDSKTPIDQLAEDVKNGAMLIKALNEKLKGVEAEVKDAFAELETVTGSATSSEGAQLANSEHQNEEI